MTKCDFCEGSVLSDGKLVCTVSLPKVFCSRAIERMEKALNPDIDKKKKKGLF